MEEKGHSITDLCQYRGGCKVPDSDSDDIALMNSDILARVGELGSM